SRRSDETQESLKAWLAARDATSRRYPRSAVSIHPVGAANIEVIEDATLFDHQLQKFLGCPLGAVPDNVARLWRRGQALLHVVEVAQRELRDFRTFADRDDCLEPEPPR